MLYPTPRISIRQSDLKTICITLLLIHEEFKALSQILQMEGLIEKLLLKALKKYKRKNPTIRIQINVSEYAAICQLFKIGNIHLGLEIEPLFQSLQNQFLKQFYP